MSIYSRTASACFAAAMATRGASGGKVSEASDFKSPTITRLFLIRWVFISSLLPTPARPDAETMNLSKDQIAEYFGISAEEKPHRAMNGVEHLIKCYRAVVASNIAGTQSTSK